MKCQALFAWKYMKCQVLFVMEVKLYLSCKYMKCQAFLSWKYMKSQVLFALEMKLKGIDLSSTTVSPKRGLYRL